MAMAIPSHRQGGYRSSLPPISPYAHVCDGVIRDWYFLILLLLAPIQSILVTPVQGSTPAFMLILMSGGFLIGNDLRYAKVLLFYAGFWIVYAIYMAFSLSGYLIDQPDLSRLTVIREIYIYGYLKQTHVTQGVYLFTALLFCFVIYQYYQNSMLKYAYYGIILLSIYGFYEFIWFAIYHTNGDFLSNRNFGDLDTAAAGAGSGDFATGSSLQTSNIFGPDFMRLKSLVGEPSMYALTVTPFTVYAFVRRWWVIFALLLLSLLLSTSTTAIIGLGIGIGYAIVRQREEAILYIIAGLITFALLYVAVEPVQMAVDKLLFQKLDTLSGTERLTSFIDHASVVGDGNVVRALFGLGFGTVRSTDMMSNLLANVGIIGFLLYSIALLAPCFLLRKGSDRDAIVATLLAIYFMEMLTVPEYAYLPPWFMVALGYARVREQRRTPALPSPTPATA
jgi:hypothetical protein